MDVYIQRYIIIQKCIAIYCVTTAVWYNGFLSQVWLIIGLIPGRLIDIYCFFFKHATLQRYSNVCLHAALRRYSNVCLHEPGGTVMSVYMQRYGGTVISVYMQCYRGTVMSV